MKNNKQILIAKEKHGTRYFDASTPELLAESAFKLLKERWDDGYWYCLDDPPEDKDVLSEEQIAALPTESLRNQESQKRKNYLRKLYDWQDNAEEYKAIENCIENCLKDKAWKLLQNRRNYEYENVELETLE
jgi:hypothetical protein